MSDLNVHFLATHAGEHFSVVLDLTPRLFQYERTKHAYFAECE